MMRWTGVLATLVALGIAEAASAQEQAVAWVDPVGVALSGGTVTKLAPSGWNGSAISRQGLGTGDGYFEFGTLETGTLKAVGLAQLSIAGTYEDLDFGFRLNPDATFDVVEGGLPKYAGGLFYLGDRFRITKTGSSVSYARNGATFYSSSGVPSKSLQLLVAAFSPGATLSNAVVGGAFQEGVVWTGQAGAGSRGNDLYRSSTVNGRAGATSTRGLSAGDGYLEIQATSVDVFACNSLSFSAQYAGTSFVGVNSGNDGTNSITLAKTGAAFLKSATAKPATQAVDLAAAVAAANSVLAHSRQLTPSPLGLPPRNIDIGDTVVMIRR